MGMLAWIMKLAVAILCGWIHCPVLGGAAIAASGSQGWSLGITLVVCCGSLVAGLIPFKREVVLSVYLGLTLGWGEGFAAMVAIVPLLAFIEWRGRSMLHRLAVATMGPPV